MRNLCPQGGRSFDFDRCRLLCGIASLVLIQPVICRAQQSTNESSRVHSESITFNQEIAPIVYEKCSMCHRPGQTGPFSLLSYQDVKQRAETMLAVIDDGYMPPWKPVNDNVHYSNDRRLGERQKAMFEQWISDGLLEGEDPKPTPPTFPDGWTLGQPDLSAKMLGRYEIPASGPDIYRSFVIPLDLTKDRWVKAIEYRPSALAAVHHAIFFVDPTGTARLMDGADGTPGIEGMGFLDNGRRFQPSSRLSNLSLGGYVPGTMPTKLPGDLAMYLPKGSDIIVQTHFHPSGKVEQEQGELAIYFAEQPPTKQLVSIQVPAMFGIGVGIRVPAGEANYVVEESYELPFAIRVVSIGAHAHYICREASMYAKLPSGESIALLEIDDWDLDWQDRYYFESPLELPAGTVLKTRLVYDNSEENPENPNSPPREIRWGRQSGDEMGSVTLQAVAVDETQRKLLERSIRRYRISSVTQSGLVDLLMQFDTNRDERLQRAELPERLTGRFPLLDRDHDGVLDRGELGRIQRLFRTPKEEE